MPGEVVQFKHLLEDEKNILSCLLGENPRLLLQTRSPLDLCWSTIGIYHFTDLEEIVMQVKEKVAVLKQESKFLGYQFRIVNYNGNLAAATSN